MSYRPGAAMRLPASLLQLGIPPGALLRTRLHSLRMALLLRALRRVAPQQQRQRILGSIRSSLLQRVRHRPPIHIVLRPGATNVPRSCSAHRASE